MESFILLYVVRVLNFKEHSGKFLPFWCKKLMY